MAYYFVPLAPDDTSKAWVTLLTCGTLLSADLAATRLRAAGIAAFLPDENLAQAMAFNLNAVGCVRVQVAPGDYAQAREILRHQVASC
jgi:hypothetical protein